MDDRDTNDGVDVPVIWLENIQIVHVILSETVDCFDVNSVVKINFKAVHASHLLEARHGVTGMDDESQRSAKHSIATFFFLFSLCLNFV